MPLFPLLLLLPFRLRLLLLLPLLLLLLFRLLLLELISGKARCGQCRLRCCRKDGR
jgi:hypothetical protein